MGNMKDLDKNYKELRRFALSYVVRNIEPHGNINTLRNLQNCFIAGYNHGRLLTTQEIAQCSEMAAMSNPRYSFGTFLFPVVSFLFGMIIRGWL